MKNLQSLSVSQLTDEDLPSLNQLTRLRYLDLKWCKVSVANERVRVRDYERAFKVCVSSALFNCTKLHTTVSLHLLLQALTDLSGMREALQRLHHLDVSLYVISLSLRPSAYLSLFFFSISFLCPCMLPS